MNKQTLQRALGVALILISGSAFGTLGILGRYAYDDGLDAPTIMCLRFTLAACVLGVVLAVRREPLPSGAARTRLIGMGALGYVGQSFCYLSAVHYASPGLVALLLYLYPACVVGLSAVWLHQPVAPRQWAALGLALVGTGLVVGPDGGGQWLGIALAVSAAVIYSVYIIVGTGVMKTVSAFQSSFVIFAAAGVGSALLMLVQGPHWPHSATGWLVIGAIVVLATILPVVTFLAGLERIGPTNAATLSTIEPVVTVMLSAALLGEAISVLAMLGGALILGAVVLLTWNLGE